MTLSKSNSNKKAYRFISLILLVLVLLSTFVGCNKANSEVTIKSVKDIKGRNIGILQGTMFEDIAYTEFPTSNVTILNSYAELLAALEAGKIDVFFADDPTAKVLCEENDSIAILDGFLDKESYGPIFSKTEKGYNLSCKFNVFISEISSNGKLETLQRKWIKSGAEARTFDSDLLESLDDHNGVIKVSANEDSVPFIYIKNNRVTGFEIELIYNFCRKNGYGLDIEYVSADAMISNVENKKSDMAIGFISYTEEREEKFYFASPEYVGGAVALIKSGEAEKTGNALEQLMLSFEKTFIRESRWKMFLEGIGITFLISTVSCVIGTALGIVFFTLSYYLNKRKTYDAIISNTIATIIRRIPIVILLMILYYVVFGTIDVSGIVVAIVAFTLEFAISQITVLNDSLKAMGDGQADAAISLGYTEMQAFFRYVLPQAHRKASASYRDEFINLVQSTSVVGYIAVEDLTRVSDLIRTHSYEALFPLVSTAIIYLILIWFLIAIVKFIGNRLSLRRTPETILKGVDTH